MKHVVRLIMLFGITMLLVQNVEADPIRMGYFILPPHIYQIEGETKPRGASITYFEAVAAHLGETVEWIGPLPLPRLGYYLKSGQKSLDGALLIPKTPDLETFLYYPDIPYYFMEFVLAVRKENPLTEIRTIDDIQGYRIGYIKTESGLYPPLIGQHLDQVQVEELAGDNWVRQNLRKLMAGRLDAALDRNQDTIPFEAIRLNVDERIKILPLPDPPIPGYIAFTKKSQRGKQLVEHYSAAIGELKLEYDNFVQKELAVSRQ